jgi:putative endonuclease
LTSKDFQRRSQAHRHGILAERFAAMALRLKGYRILNCRYRVKGGEIDIVARRADTIAFVEVKVRPSLAEAATSIDFIKRRRMSRAARVWLASNPWAAPFTWRGDAVYVVPWRWPRHGIAVIELDLG